MSHNCPECGELCYCDIEDAFTDNNLGCLHYKTGCLNPDDIPDDEEIQEWPAG